MESQQKIPIQSQNSPSHRAEKASPDKSLPAQTTFFSDRWLTAARKAWWIVTLVVVGLTAINIPISFNYLNSICPQQACFYQLNSSQAHLLESLGLSLTFYAAFFTGFVTLIVAFYIVVGFVLFQHPSTRWIGLLGAYTLVLFGGITFPEMPTLVSLTYPALQPPFHFLDYLGNILLPLFVIVFPDGKLKPRWTIGLIGVWALLRFPRYFFPGSKADIDTWPPGLQIIIWVGFIGSLILVQYYRYRRLFGPVLRQQTKWVVYGLMVSLGGFIAAQTALALVPVSIVQTGLLPVFRDIAIYFLMILIPISFAISILRYRLWEIDVIINWTLVYVSLTAIVGGLYSATITLIQKIFIATTGQKSDTALVIATFVIVSTITPIKNGLQTAVDKRFKDTKNPLKEIHSLDQQVRSVIEVLDVGQITRRLLDTAINAFQASGGAIYLEQAGQMVLAHSTPGWREEDSQLNLPLGWNNRQTGTLQLGAREGGVEYSAGEIQILQLAANRVARVIAGFTAGKPESKFD